MERFDVLIVGAGVAGASCAIECAKKGLRVALIEKAALPRYKACGGGVVARAKESMPEAFGSVCEVEVSQALLSWQHSKRELLFEMEQPFIYMVMRERLDAMLCEEAKRLGVSLYSGKKVQRMEQTEEGVNAVLQGLQLQGTFLIGADGAASSVAKQCGFKSNAKNTCYAIEAEVVLEPRYAEHFMLTRFDFEVMPKGYAWLFPKKEQLSLGVMAYDKKDNARLKQYYREYLHFLGIDEEMIQSEHLRAHGIPIKKRPGGIAKERVLLIGDAAGLCDALTGEGISAALLSARFAAEAVAMGGTSAEVCAAYEKAVEKHFDAESVFSHKCAEVLYFKPRLLSTLLRHVSNKSLRKVAQIFLGEKSFGEFFQSLSFSKRLLLRFFVR